MSTVLAAQADSLQFFSGEWLHFPLVRHTEELAPSALFPVCLQSDGIMLPVGCCTLNYISSAT